MASSRRWSARHDSQKVDLAFVVDCTGSMGTYINETQRHINYIAETISRTAFNVHLALVEYRDHPPQDSTFVTRTHDFTNSPSEMKGWVDGMSASGGGDAPEAVADGLYDALNLTYRPQATKICVWIGKLHVYVIPGDAQPHGLDTNRDLDQFPDGCPANRDPIQICHDMAAKGIILYCVGCEPSLSLYREFFMGLSLITGGQYIRLHGAKLLTQVIVMLTREEVENENLMGYVDDHLHLELQANANATVDRLANSLHTVLRLNNNRTRRMRYNNTEIEPFTDLARRVSHMRTIAQAAAAMQPSFQAGRVAAGGEDVGLLTSTDITDLDEVSPRQCERLVRRSLARNGRQARESTDAVMDLN